jgi:hypothetical protein
MKRKDCREGCGSLVAHFRIKVDELRFGGFRVFGFHRHALLLHTE